MIPPLTPEQLTEFAEIEIRGRLINMACDLEWTMLLIMVHITPDPYNQLRNFTGMMMNQKIECTISDLKKYKQSVYDEYEEELNKLKDVKDLRNDMAHHKIDMDADLQSFRFLYVDKYEEKERIFEKRYMVKDIADINNQVRKLNLTLVEVLLKVGGGNAPATS